MHTLTNTLCGGNNCMNIDDLMEDVPILSNYFKKMAGVASENDRFVQCMRYDSGGDLRVLNNSPMPVQMCALARLFNTALLQPANIRALKIHFGLKGADIIFIFQPICLSNPVKIHWSNKYRYSISWEDNFYTYNDSDCTFNIEPNAITLINNYKQQARIIHDGTVNPPEPLTVNTNTWEDDTLSVIFSLRELLQLYHSIYSCDNADLNKYSEFLYFYNGVSQYRHNWHDFDLKNKHNIFITTALLSNPDGWVIDKAANMGHLCPPSCNPIYEL